MIRGHSLIPILRNPPPWQWWETSALRTSSSQVVPETASCSTRMTSPDSRETVSTSQLTGRRNPCLPPPRKVNTSLPTPRRMCRVPPAKRRNHARPAAGSWGLLYPGSLTPMKSKKSSHQTKCSPQAEEQLDKCDTGDHNASSKHKDRSCSDKSSRCSSDKESSSTAHKHALSPLPHASFAECPWKGPCVDDSSHASGESSCTSHRSPSGSMSELKDHRSFTMPTKTLIPINLGLGHITAQALLIAGAQ